MTKPLLLTLLLITVALSLKHSELGRNDWHKENIGQLQFATLVQNKLFYLTKQNVLGHIKLQSGQIQSRITLSPHEQLLSVNQREVTLLTDNNQLITYRTQNLEKSTNNRLVTDRMLKTINSYVKSTDGKIAIVNDEKNIRSFSLAHTKDLVDQQHTEVYTAQPHEIIQKVFSFNGKLYAIILTQTEFVFRQILDGKLQTHQVSLQSLSPEGIQHLSITEAWQAENTLVIVLHNKISNQQQTLVLDKNFHVIYQSNQAYNQVILNQLLFCSKIYNLKSQQETDKLTIFEDSYLNVDYTMEDLKNQVKIFKGGVNYAQLQKPSTQIKIKHIFFLEKSSAAFVAIVQYCDMTLVAYSIENGVEKKLWQREQGLAFIHKVLFMKYSFSDHLDNEYHRNLLSSTYLEMSIAQKLARVPYNIALRVREEIADLVEIFVESLQSLLNVSKLDKLDLKSLAKFTMSDDQQLKLGLKKYIIAVTTTGAIYAIDTKSQQILWKKHHQTTRNNEVIGLIDLRKDYELEAAVLVTYNVDQKLLVLQEIKQNGDINLLDKIPCPSVPSIHKLNHESLIINYGDKTMRYQLGEGHGHEKHFYFYTEEEDRIVGWKQNGENVVEIWNFNLDQGEKIIASTSAYTNEQSTHIPLIDNGKVIYKNVDFTNLAVLTSKNATSMSLYIINGMTGQVHFNEYRSGLNLNHPVNLAYDQNNVIVTFYNNRNKLYEIWVVEEYQEKIESSALNMIKDYLEGSEYKPSRNRENIIFLSQVFGSPVSIKKMFISQSKESLIRRNLFIITRDDKLYMIGRELVSTRRPKETALFSNEVYPPYQYLIPYDSTKFFSYNLDLYGLKNVEFSPSDMESTVFILGYGTDVFLIRVAPDMPFDMITEDFNYLVLVAIMVAVTVGVLVLRYKAVKARLVKPHRD